jgi:broad specificity phosphatase PhoE
MRRLLTAAEVLLENKRYLDSRRGGRYFPGMNKVLLALAVVFMAASSADAGEVILVVRHAEKLDNSQNPPLSAAGEARAQRLAKVLQSYGVTSIYVSEYARTANTAAPVATARKLVAKVHPAKDTAGLVAELKADPGRILVVAHSNTVPEIVAAFDPTQKITLTDADYDNLFVIIGNTVVRLRY